MDSKPFWQSRTIWGGLITFLVALAATFGIELPFGAEALTEAVMTLVGAVGALLVVIGRAGAKTSIS